MFAAVLTCLRLGWWQWERTQEATGTAQNFGYALLWPGFGVAFVYMWVRFLHLEVIKDAEDDEQTDRELRELLDSESPAESGHDEQVAAPDRSLPAPESWNVLDRKGSGDPASAVGTVGEAAQEAVGDESDTSAALPAHPRRRSERQRPSQSVTISVAMVGEDDDDDPELTAYNQALAALAKEDRRRAR